MGRMTRIAAGILMACIAIALAIFGSVSMFVPVSASWELTDRVSVVPHFYDGRVRVFVFWCPFEPIEVIPAAQGPDFRVQRKPTPDSGNPRTAPPPNWSSRRWGTRISIGNARAVPSFGGRWRANLAAGWRAPLVGGRPITEMTYFRLPIWIIVVALLIHPIRAVVLGPLRDRRRRRNNECTNCGYNLTGLPEPRCPECGTGFADRFAAEDALP